MQALENEYENITEDKLIKLHEVGSHQHPQKLHRDKGFLSTAGFETLLSPAYKGVSY